MKFAGRFILVAVLLSAAVARSQDAAGPSKPYAPIVTRNVFGLLPIPVVDPASLQPPGDPPPKITPNGIMTIFGQLQALFKVSVKPPPGQPAKDASYVLGVGERQDDIEVIKIDEQGGVVTFNNHGTIQELPLIATPASSGTPQPGPITAPGANPGIPPPRPRGFGAPPAAGTGGGISSGGRKITSGGNPDASGVGMPGFGSGGGSAANVKEVNNKGIYQPAAGEAMSPEARIIMMEAQRAEWINSGRGNPAIIPPTPLTQQVTGQGEPTGGTP